MFDLGRVNHKQEYTGHLKAHSCSVSGGGTG